MSGASMLELRSCDRDLLRMGVPLRFGFKLDAGPDFLGLPRRLTGEESWASFKGTVVVVVRVIRLIEGDSRPSPSEPLSGSA